jgi:cytochrome c peroxidase
MSVLHKFHRRVINTRIDCKILPPDMWHGSHLLKASRLGGQYLFTDFTFEAIGVPRNTSIPATVTHPGLPVTYYDLGLCTAQNPTTPHTLPAAAPYCGMFKTPTLRNVATRQAFFHNGVFHTLTDLLNWYNTRDTNPAAWLLADRQGPSVLSAEEDDHPWRARPAGGA